MSDKPHMSAALEAEDELSAPLSTSRGTPQHLLAGKVESVTKPTPYANLHQLAGLIRQSSTPTRLQSSFGDSVPRTYRSSATPPTHLRPPSGLRRPLQPTSGNRSNRSTPHAVKALQQLRAAPGQNRRKSGRLQRETPRDILRNLSRAFVHIYEHPKPSELPVAAEAKTQLPGTNDSSEDELSPDQPRLSSSSSRLHEDEDSFDAPPPPLSLIKESEEQTVRSVEIPRREERRERFFRQNLGDIDNEDDLLQDWSLQSLDSTRIDHHTGTRTPSLGEGGLIREGYSGDKGTQSANTEDIRKQLLEDVQRPQSRLEKAHEIEQIGGITDTPFVLQIPNYESRLSSENIRKLSENLMEGQLYLSDKEDLFGVDPLRSEALEAPSMSGGLVKISTPVKSNKVWRLKRSRHGITYATLPVGITKSLALASAPCLGTVRRRLSKETIRAIAMAGESFLEQLGGDLENISTHANRKTINEADLFAIMKRQRHVSVKATVFALANKYLPRELVRNLRVQAKVLPWRKELKIAHPSGDLEDEADIL